MKNCLKIFTTTIIAIVLLTQVCFANDGYNVNSIDKYVGQKIINLKYFHSSGSYYPYEKRLDKKGNLQCVGYAYARLEEKLGLSPDFRSGAGAKDIPGNAPNGATRTAIDGTVYTINVYKNDGGSHITADCWVSFGAGSSQYGHVIYVEEVIGDNIYYTESGTNMWKKGTTGTLRKKSKYDFINKCSSGGKYVGTVVFTPKSSTKSQMAETYINMNTPCSHSYNKSGYCSHCNKEYPITLTSMNDTYQTVKNDVPIRNRPYSPDTIIKYLAKGTKVKVVAAGKNSVGNLWYKLNDGTWIYSGNLEKATINTNTSTNSNSTSIRFELESVPSGNLAYGKSFSLKGWFRSDSAIVEARAYMLDANKNIVMQSDKASSTTSNYKIQGYKLDKAMKFNKLSPGAYYLKYYVKDADGDTATWISEKFYIVR